MMRLALRHIGARRNTLPRPPLGRSAELTQPVIDLIAHGRPPAVAQLWVEKIHHTRRQPGQSDRSLKTFQHVPTPYIQQTKPLTRANSSRWHSKHPVSAKTMPGFEQRPAQKNRPAEAGR